MSNNGHNNGLDVDFFDAVERYLPIVGPHEPSAIFSPFFGKQYECTVLAVTADGYFVENCFGKYTFLLPFSEARAAGLGDLQIGQSVIIFSTVLDERTGIWLATCHPLALDDHDLALVQKAVESGDWIEVKVSGQNARGLRLVCGTIGGFMFFSNVDWARHHRNGSQPNLIGQTILVRITSCTDYRGLPNFYACERDEELIFDWSEASVGTVDSFPVAVGEIAVGTVTGFLGGKGAFLDLGNGVCGLMPISEIDYRFIASIFDEFELGQRVKVKVLNVEWVDGKHDQRKLHIVLSQKALKPAPIMASAFEEEFDYWDQ